jgi:anti-sigma B factor antagonist
VHLGSLDYPGRIWLSYFESRSSDFGRPVVPAIAGKSSFEKEVFVETAIGVFSSREKAEDAVKSLLEHEVPEYRIIYLTRSESEAKSMGKRLAARPGGPVEGAASMPADVAAATVFTITGVGPVFVLGSGAASLMEAGTGTGAPIGAADDSHGPAPSNERFSQESDFFRRVLNEGYSVVVVRTESSQIASTACKILDQLSLSMKRPATPKSTVSLRQAHGAVVADIVGKIALAEGTGLLRATINNSLERGHNRIVLNLERVEFIDSAGLGELVRSHASIRNRGGQLKLVNPSANVHRLLKITKLDQVFEIEPDEYSALRSLREATAAKSAG